jgi:hypothetical protein
VLRPRCTGRRCLPRSAPPSRCTPPLSPPTSAQASTKLSLKATAGLRLLPGTKAQDILDAVKAFFKQYPFQVKDGAVAILDGASGPGLAWRGVLGCAAALARCGCPGSQAARAALLARWPAALPPSARRLPCAALAEPRLLARLLATRLVPPASSLRPWQRTARAQPPAWPSAACRAAPPTPPSPTAPPQLHCAWPRAGKDEGAFAWLTLNYLLGKLGGDISTTVAAIDMGGGSIQEAFAVSSAEGKAAPEGYVSTLHGNGQTYNVYVHRWGVAPWCLPAAGHQALQEAGGPCGGAGSSAGCCPRRQTGCGLWAVGGSGHWAAKAVLQAV